MTREHSWRQGCRSTLLAAVVLAVVCLATPARGQTAGSPAATCTIAGQACFTADQLQQLAKLGNDVMARRVAADSPVASAVRGVVDYWVAYSVALGSAVAYSYLPG